jgi:hypothetical protein
MTIEGDHLTGEFVRRLGRLTPSEWATVRQRVEAAKPSLWIWDEAWEGALALGAGRWSEAAMAAAAAVPGNSPAVQAMAGSAAGALAVRSRLAPRHFEVLYGPFAGIIDLEGAEEVAVSADPSIGMGFRWCPVRVLERLAYGSARHRRSYA